MTKADLQDQRRRTMIGVGLVSADRAHLVEVLAGVERFVGRPQPERSYSRRQQELRSNNLRTLINCSAETPFEAP